VKGSIERQGNFQSIAANPKTGLVYAANSDSGSVDVIMGTQLWSTVSKGNGERFAYPKAVSVNPETGMMYLADNNSVIAMDGNRRQVASIGVGSTPMGIAVNPETNMVYLANFGSDSVSVIDGSTNSVVLTAVSFVYEIVAGAAVAAIAGAILVWNRKKSAKQYGK
jgi:YVTN family beta-propeller protein